MKKVWFKIFRVPSAGLPVEGLGLIEQAQQDLDGFGSGVDFGLSWLCEFPAQAFPLVVDGPHACGQLLLGPVGIAHEFDVGVLLLLPCDSSRMRSRRPADASLR